MKNQIVIIAGMPRAGTTFLYNTLQAHPDIFVTFRKELNYFSYNYSKGEKWYLDKYKEIKKNQIGFDVSPIYFLDDLSIKRIYNFNPDVKVILIIRNPVDWIISLYNQICSLNYEKHDLPDFFKKIPIPVEHKTIYFEIYPGFIIEKIKQFQNTFQKNLLIYNFSDFEKHPLSLLTSIEKFIDVTSYFNENNFNNIKINSSKRINSPLVNMFLFNKCTIKLAEFFPRKLILFLRNKFDKISATINFKNNRNIITTSDLNFAKEFFEKDTEFINNLWNKKI